jgi:hypothetical protein
LPAGLNHEINFIYFRVSEAKSEAPGEAPLSFIGTRVGSVIAQSPVESSQKGQQMKFIYSNWKSLALSVVVAFGMGSFSPPAQARAYSHWSVLSEIAPGGRGPQECG